MVFEKYCGDVTAAGETRPAFSDLTPHSPSKTGVNALMLGRGQSGFCRCGGPANRLSMGPRPRPPAQRAAPAPRPRGEPMPRHPFVPAGVIPAVLLPFADDLSVDEASFRSHPRHVASVEGLSAITVNAHSTEVGSCTFEEQRRVMAIAAEEVGDRLPIVHGIWADGSIDRK